MATLVVVQFLFLSLALSVHSEDTFNGPACLMYGIGEVSECTTGFPSLFHIDEAEGNTDVDISVKRQVVIPDIHFRCNGTIRKWIIGARWKGKSGANAYTELQIWRRSSDSVYTKVGSTTIMVGTENDSQLYEYPLETPLAFQEGDVVGYFQPRRNVSKLRLYLEDSNRLITYGENTEAPQSYFDISSSHSRGDRYPFIGLETDPPGCGCGFMTVERMYSLLHTTITKGNPKSYSGQQLIFPDIGFTCSGEVAKWIMGGEWDENDEYYPQLQIWRPLENGTYHRLDGSTISATVERNDNVYKFIADPPIPFQSGDIVGLFQPQSGVSKLQVDYDNKGMSMSYYISTESDEVVSSYDTIDISNDEDLRTTRALPLISVEIVISSTTSRPDVFFHTSTAASTPILVVHQSTVSPLDVHSFTTIISSTTSRPDIFHTSTAASTLILVVQQSTLSPLDVHSFTTSAQVTPTAALPDIISSSGGVSVNSISVGVGVAGALLVLTIAPVIAISLLVCLRRRNNKLNTVNNVDNGTVLHINTTEIHDYSYPYNMSTSLDPNEMYSDQSSPEGTCIPTSSNPAYLQRGIDFPISNDISTTTNQAYLEGGPIYDDADIPTSTNQSYLERELWQSGSDTLPYDDIYK